MIKRFLHTRIARLETSFGYDAAYLHEILDVSLAAFVKFSLFQLMSAHQDGVPADAYFAAKIASTLSEDCGPCAQLGVDMALRAGIRADRIAALLRGDLENAGPDMELGFHYGIAVATNSPDAVELADRAEKRFGTRGRVSLTLAVASARVYPALKRGLGHGAACTKIVIANDIVVMKHVA